MDKEIMDLLEKWIMEALQIQQQGTATQYTAPGMAYHMYQELEEIGAFGEPVE